MGHEERRADEGVISRSEPRQSVVSAVMRKREPRWASLRELGMASPPQMVKPVSSVKARASAADEFPGVGEDGRCVRTISEPERPVSLV